MTANDPLCSPTNSRASTPAEQTMLPRGFSEQSDRLCTPICSRLNQYKAPSIKTKYISFFLKKNNDNNNQCQNFVCQSIFAIQNLLFSSAEPILLFVQRQSLSKNQHLQTAFSFDPSETYRKCHEEEAFVWLEMLQENLEKSNFTNNKQTTNKNTKFKLRYFL